MRDIKDVLNLLKKNHNISNYNEKLLLKAWEFACVAHQGQKRLSGEEYITHPLETAYTLTKWKMNVDTVIAGLLHDVLEENAFTVDDIKSEFGSDIAQLVEGDTKIGTIKYSGAERYAENLRKMFIAMSKDIRVIIIRFADRLHNLKTLKYHKNQEKRYRIALESLEIYAPIAGRLGMYKIKEELEDLSFKYVYPVEYKWTIKQFKSQIGEKTLSLNQTKKNIIKILKENKVQFHSIYGRQKRLYSLYLKLLKKDKDINKIYDLIALRIIVKDIETCYSTLGIIHNHYQPLNGRVKDYISQKKPNGYQSLHTTVFNETHNPIEIQIRTAEMDNMAEFGIASHWSYEDKTYKNLENQNLDWIKDLVKWQGKIKNNRDYIKSIKLNTDIFKSRIFIFTPKNDVIDLPEGSTPIDFAYHIHTDIGNKCVSVKINNKIAKLDAELKNGDVVEIITDKNRIYPNPDWLNFVKTNTAKEKIKNSSLKEVNTTTKRIITRLRRWKRRK
ncbi:MAG TPA: RelA/SpoT family protein [bacterium]|jgi:GTP pyrophosphokinase|nr:RelA/SpoT family protein [bacterium]HOG38106.1 RelA/SpoT family protein [bacterium]HQI03162.1 RelA/SpoT family protein [bacterium]